MNRPTSREIAWSVAIGASVASQGLLVGWSPLLFAAVVIVPLLYLFVRTDGVRMAVISLSLGGAGMSVGGALDEWMASGTFAVCQCEGGHPLISLSTGVMLLACGLGCWFACPRCSRLSGADRWLQAGLCHGMMLAGMYGFLLVPRVNEIIGAHFGMVIGMGIGTLIGCGMFHRGRMIWPAAPAVEPEKSSAILLETGNRE